VSDQRKQEHLASNKIWVMTSLGNPIDEQKKEKEVQKIMARIHGLNIKDRKTKIRILWLKYAAVALFIASLSGSIGYFISDSQKGNISGSGFTEIMVPNGERSNVVLPDGSSVNLNAGSVLKFAPSFISQTREVILQGEAFFKVKHDNSRPFIVKTDNLEIQVLGTNFNVSNYPDDSSIITFLEKGKIQIYLEDDNFVLKPREVLEYNKVTGESSKLVVTDDHISDWTKGILTVKGETIEELSKKLERKFNVQIVFGDEEVKNHIYTGSIKDDDINVVLEALEFVSSLKFKRENDIVYLYAK
jgi:ferric-dicitrate binding protein FerR (iron transport regulator)